METKDKTQVISQGVKSLIDRLRNEGITAGKTDAEKIIKQAQEQANKMINDARIEAKKLIEQAHQKIVHEKQAAEDALQLAARNMRIELRQVLIDRFKEEVERLVHKELTDETTIRQLILLLALKTADQLQEFKNKHIEIELPAAILEFDDIRKNPKLLEKDPLKLLVQGITYKFLKEGVSVTIDKDKPNETGIKARIVGEDIEFDLTETAITALLMKHLQPRFRALLEGLLQ
jgi:V/A-type H+/Na+-transporting ATPase subunit E